MTKDSSSLIIILNNWLMAVIRLNFIVAGGVGKYARIVKATSRLTNFFVLGVLECWMEHCSLVVGHRREWRPWKPPWWEGDWSSIHVGSHRKAYQVKNDFLICQVPEL